MNPFRPARAALTIAAPLILIAGCGTDTAEKAAAASATPRSFTLTAEQRAKITVDTVTLTNFRPVLDVTGTVAFNGDRSTQVLSSISGPVARLVAPLGAQVSPGDLLATVSSPDFASAVADLRKAEAAHANAVRTTARAQALFRNDALARADLDQAVTDSTAAAADLDAAVQALRALGVGDATVASVRAGASATPIEAAIRAPIAGTVVERLVNPGQVLEAGATPTFTIADLGSMWVNASVYGADVALVRADEAVDVIVDGAARPVRGRVDYVAPIVDPATKATAVRIVAENPGQILKRDLFVQLRIHAATERRGLLVSSTAVLRDDENLPFVFIAAADGTFLRRRVTLGRHADLRYEILDGLAAGDRVVSNGALFIQFAESQ
ncbi:MAG TPA: efflux RND transporter periplasmic adaptor subunit [Gemmatimonadaceae bacterium]|nr:efflux RND transporter periplasmic adaptor subunit [Gemmatimonadaceae bacterium]